MQETSVLPNSKSTGPDHRPTRRPWLRSKESLETLDPSLKEAFDAALSGPVNHKDLHGHTPSDLTGPLTYRALHPLLQDEYTEHPPWLDPQQAMEALTEVNLAFRENTAGLHHEEKAWVAYQVATALTAPMTHPIQQFKEQYLALPGQEGNEHHITSILAAVESVSDRLDEYRETLQGALQMENLQFDTQFAILEQMDYTAAQANSFIAEHLLSSLEQHTAGMDPDDRAREHYALAHTLAAPLHAKASRALEKHDTPFTSTLRQQEDHPPDAGTPEWVQTRVLQDIDDDLRHQRRQDIIGIRDTAQHHTDNLASLLDSNDGTGTGTKLEFTDHLTTLSRLQAALEFQDSHLSDAQHIVHAVQNAAINVEHPGRYNIAAYVANALSAPTTERLNAHARDTSPHQFRAQGLPHHEEYFSMTYAAAGGVWREALRLNGRILDNLDAAPNAEGLAHSIQALANLPEVLEHTERTGYAPECLDPSAAQDFEQATQHRNNLMLQDMEKHLLEQHPHIFQQEGQTWTERLQYPALMAAMSDYSRQLPAADQRRLANTVLQRSWETAPTTSSH